MIFIYLSKQKKKEIPQKKKNINPNMTIKGSLQGLSILAIIAIIPPFFWHIKTKNIQALTLLTWLFLYNLKIFVDATVWSKDIIDLMTG